MYRRDAFLETYLTDATGHNRNLDAMLIFAFSVTEQVVMLQRL